MIRERMDGGIVIDGTGVRTGHDPRPVKVGRNDPCPCESGRKAKTCHLRGSRWVVEYDERTTLHGDAALAYLVSDEVEQEGFAGLIAGCHARLAEQKERITAAARIQLERNQAKAES